MLKVQVMKDTRPIPDSLEGKESFSREEFNVAMREAYELREPQIAYDLNKRLANGTLVRTGWGQYSLPLKKEYRYEYSPQANEVAEIFTNKDDSIPFQILELGQFCAREDDNSIFVSVEEDSAECAFDTLWKLYPGKVMMKPKIDEYRRYRQNGEIIIMRLPTESPKGTGEKWKSRLEKVLVDVFTDKLISKIITDEEKMTLLRESFSLYRVDVNTMLRYAKRKGAEKKILDILDEFKEEQMKTEELYVLGKETEQIEFKRSTGELKEGVISIASILNKHGEGKLYFGVQNDGTVTGQVVGEDTLRTISQAVFNHIKPTIHPEIIKESYGGKAVVTVSFQGTRQPYTAYNIPRIRVADEDLVMAQPAYLDMLRVRDDKSYSWEKQCSKYKVSDIDEKVFTSFMTKARKAGRIDFEGDEPLDVLTKLGLTEGEYLLNAGAALFVDCGLNELQMAKFASDERLTFTDIRRFTGPILSLADKAVRYVIDAMDWRVEFDGRLERREIPEIPVEAVREAVINAFAHRLIESGQSVEVAVYRSFIEIYSPGTFPEGITPEMFIREIRKPVRRNPLITRTLYYSKDMESFATGLKRIQKLCDEAGCKVEYYEDGYGFTVRFYRRSVNDSTLRE